MFGEIKNANDNKKEIKTPTPKLFANNNEKKDVENKAISISIDTSETITIKKIYRKFKFAIINKIEEIKLEIKKNSKIFFRVFMISIIALLVVFYLADALKAFHNFNKSPDENYVEVNSIENIEEKEEGFFRSLFKSFYKTKNSDEY